MMAMVTKVSRRSKPRAQRDQGIRTVIESTRFFSVYYIPGSVPDPTLIQMPAGQLRDRKAGKYFTRDDMNMLKTWFLFLKNRQQI